MSIIPAMSEDSRVPTVSVVIPVKNGGPGLRGTVESVLGQSLPTEFDVFVVDNGSTDGAVGGLGSLAAQDPRLHLLSEDRPGPSAARNHGWRSSRAPIIAFLDADCRALPGWLAAGLEVFSDPKVGIAGGALDNVGERTWIARQERLNQSLAQFNTLRHGFRPYVVSANMFARREALEAVSGFDPDLRGGEDADVCWRAQDAGWRVEAAEAAHAQHRNRETARALFRQHLIWGDGMFSLTKKYPALSRDDGPLGARGVLSLGRRAIVAAAAGVVREDEREHRNKYAYWFIKEFGHWYGYQRARLSNRTRRVTA